MRKRRLQDRFKKLRQRLSRSPAGQRALTRVLALYIRLVHRTSRIIWDMPDSVQPYYAGDANCIFAFWHGRLLMVPPIKPKQRGMFVLISRHNDGELIARTLRHFDIGTVRGSTSKGGGRAAREVITRFRAGENITITPDGPRGPNRAAQAGIIHLARLCQCPIIPVALSSSRHKALRSWDRMQVALPFGKLAICVDEPLVVSPEGGDEAVEAARLQLETRLNVITSRADTLAGLSADRSARSATQREPG